MLLHRWIYRLDYKFNPGICDAPGRVISQIMEKGSDLFVDIQDAAPQRTLSVPFSQKIEGKYGKLTVSPQSMTYSVEWDKPQSVLELLRYDEIAQGMEVIASIQSDFDIDYILRSGCRVFQFGIAERAGMVEKFSSMIDNNLVGGVSKIFGDVTDVGINFDGANKNGLKYHFRAGPHIDNEHNRYFESVQPSDVFADYGYICDIDAYENNTRMKGTTPQNWIRPLLKGFTQSGNDICRLLGV